MKRDSTERAAAVGEGAHHGTRERVPSPSERLPHAAALAVWMAALFLAIPIRAGEPHRVNSPTPGFTNPPRHWAFTPPVRPAEPPVLDGSWIRNPIDRFILARLEKERLSPSPEADRRTLIRRLTFGLTGLPPTPEEVAGFVNDPRPDACERLVEQLLESPHYGERWGRHWLDVAGYADSNGYFDADTARPLAYRYRDYVVRAFNEDRPFDRFIQEQIAGDELAGYVPDGDVTPEMAGPLTATHFLRNAPDGTGESDGNPLEQKVDRYSVLEGTVQVLGSAFLGLTVQCARCHDHKFEPLTQDEYYQLQSIFRPAYDPAHWRKPNERVVTIALRAVRTENEQKLEQHARERKALQESVEGAAAPFRKLLVAEKLAALDGSTRSQVQTALDVKEQQRTDEMKALLKTHEALISVTEEEVGKRFPELSSPLQGLREALRRHEAARPAALPQLAVLTETGNPPSPHRVLIRGNYAQEGREVEAGVPGVLSSSDNLFPASAATHASASQAPGSSSGRRLALARWLTSPHNPMVARLIVNRLWQRHFGEGLVATLDNFGRTGATPSHPELLDYLAVELIQSGWRVKAVQRLIVTSSAYRQSSAFRAQAHAVDPENRWLWRFRLQRLDAEAMHDAMLAAAGELEASIGGPFVPAEKTPEGQYIVSEKAVGARRRALYLQQRRTQPLTMLALFDGAQMNPNCVRRSTATVPLQSLALLNSEFVRARSRALALRVLREVPGSAEARIHRAFELGVGRGPNPEEGAAATAFLESQARHYPDGARTSEFVWTDFCQMVLASNLFLYIE